MRKIIVPLSCLTLLFSLLFASPALSAAANDGRTGKDFSDLLYSSRNLLEDFDMAKAQNMCGAKEAINAVHTLFITRATLYAGSEQDPAETRNWSTVAGTSTSITIDWTPYSSRSSAGVIMVRGTVESDCTGKSPRDLKWASVRFNIPVNVGKNGQFYASAPKDIHIDTVCCGSQRITRTALFTPTGQIIRAEGTIFPPIAAAPPPPPRPRTGGGFRPPPRQPVTTSPPAPKPVTVSTPAPQPKPEPWTMENPCPECEDEKAIVDHLRLRIADLTKEKVGKQGELRTTNSEISDLEKEIKRLEARLKAQEGTGAEAFDPATGIRTTAYDQGDGTVVVKRIYPDGREETVDTYTRRSAEDIRRELTAKKQKLERLKSTKSRLEKRIASLDSAIKKAEDLLADAMAAFKACLEACNRKLGISSAAIAVPASSHETAMGPAGVQEPAGTTTVTQSSTTTSAAMAKNVEEVVTAAEKTAVETAQAAGDAVASVSSGADKITASTGVGSYSSLDWQLKYKWSSGYTYFNEDGNIDYDFKIEPQMSTFKESDGLSLNAEYSFKPTATTTEWYVGVKYPLTESYNIAGVPFTYDSGIPQSPARDQASASIDKLFPPYFSYVNRAYDLLDDGAPASYVGRQIGAFYRGKPGVFIFPSWYLAALETLDILDDYDEFEEDIYPDEYGIAVAHAVLAAGGSVRDAAIMGARATAWGGGSSVEVSKVLLSITFSGYALNMGGNNIIGWNDLAIMQGIVSSFIQLPTGFSENLLQEHPPTNYFGLRYRSRIRIRPNPNFFYIPDPEESGTDSLFNWEQIAPRVGFNYDIGGGSSNRFSLPGRDSSAQQYYTPRIQGFQLDSTWIRENLDINVKPEDNYSSIMHVPTGLFVSSFGENNMGRKPQKTEVTPNDPLYREEGGSLVGSLTKKSFGLVMGVLGVGGVSTNDQEADYQWGMHAVGLTPKGSQSGWDIYDGAEPNVVVAVIDSGSDFNHPDGPAYFWRNTDEIPDNNKDDDNNGYVDDVHGWNFISENNNVQDDFGHGAFVAGIIAAKTNNGIGIAGINPGARIMTLKVSGNRGETRSLGIYRAIRYAVDNDARIINISLGSQGLSRLEELGINYAWNMGCLVVVAAGNQAGIVSEYGPPGAPRAFSVAAVNVDGKRRGTSNRGRSVTIAAPGESIYSLSSSMGRRDGTIMPISNTEYHRLNGTSFAAPFVSGAASLIWAKYPELSNRQVANILMASADDIGEPGWDTRTGSGMLNVRRALAMGSTPAPGLRISDIRVGRDGSRINWVDLYGVVDGPVESYTIAVAEGSDPDEDEYVEVYGPAATRVDNGLLCRIPGEKLEGRRWTFRLAAVLSNGDRKSVTMAFDRDGKIAD